MPRVLFISVTITDVVLIALSIVFMPVLVVACIIGFLLTKLYVKALIFVVRWILWTKLGLKTGKDEFAESVKDLYK